MKLCFWFHPDQSEQVPAMVDRYKGMIAGRRRRSASIEDWGRRQLTFPISKVHKRITSS